MAFLAQLMQLRIGRVWSFGLVGLVGLVVNLVTMALLLAARRELRRGRGARGRGLDRRQLPAAGALRLRRPARPARRSSRAGPARRSAFNNLEALVRLPFLVRAGRGVRDARGPGPGPDHHAWRSRPATCSSRKVVYRPQLPVAGGRRAAWSWARRHDRAAAGSWRAWRWCSRWRQSPRPAADAQAAPTCAAEQWSAEFFDGTALAGAPVAGALRRRDRLRLGARPRRPRASRQPVLGALDPHGDLRGRRLRLHRHRRRRASGSSSTAPWWSNGWADQGATTYSATVPVTAGAAHGRRRVLRGLGGRGGPRLLRARAARRSEAAGPPSGRRRYFTGTSLAGVPVLERCDAAVDFDWGAGRPGPALPVNKFSARWTQGRHVRRPAATTSRRPPTTASGSSSTARRLNGWNDQSGVTYAETVPVTAGAHTVVVEYYEAYGDARGHGRASRPPRGEPHRLRPRRVERRVLHAAGAWPALRCSSAATPPSTSTGAPAPRSRRAGQQLLRPLDQDRDLRRGRLRLHRHGRRRRPGPASTARWCVDGWGDHGATTYTEAVPVTRGGAHRRRGVLRGVRGRAGLGVVRARHRAGPARRDRRVEAEPHEHAGALDPHDPAAQRQGADGRGLRQQPGDVRGRARSRPPPGTR